MALHSDLNFHISVSSDLDASYAQSICEQLGKSIVECLIKHDEVTPTLIAIIEAELRLCFESLRAMRKVFQYRMLCNADNNTNLSMSEGYVIVDVQFAHYEGEPPIDVRITNICEADNGNISNT